MVGNWAMDEVEPSSEALGTSESMELEAAEEPEPSQAETPEDEDGLERGGEKE